jgi:hypothetical protein
VRSASGTQSVSGDGRDRHLRLETHCCGKVVYETPRIERDLAPTAVAAFRPQFLILRGIHERVTNELAIGD